MTYVVDANVAIKWVVEEELSEQALTLLDDISLLEAPDLIIPETTNIAWKKCMRGELSYSQAKNFILAIQQFVQVLHPSQRLSERAIRMAVALQHPAYDCFYLACAEFLNAVMVTADERFYTATQGTEFSKLVIYLGNIDAVEIPVKIFPPLEISSSKLKRIIQFQETLEQTSYNLHDKLRFGEEIFFISSEDLKLLFDTPAWIHLRSCVEGLDQQELSEILALGWLGQGYSGNHWEEIRQRAEEAIVREGSSYLNYVCSLVCYLEDGLDILRRSP